MSNQETSTSPSSSALPAYISGAIPNPQNKRAPWYKNTAPTYAGIFLWFAFWQGAGSVSAPGGALSQGLGWALVSLVISALICHFLFYMVPGLLGMKTGLPLYIVGTSTFGAKGGFLLPGFLMGVLQFGWLGVNIFFSSGAINDFLVQRHWVSADFAPTSARIIMVIWGVAAAFIGLKGIQYVAKVATYLPLVPIAILLFMLAKTIGGVGDFSSATTNPIVDSQSAIWPDAKAGPQPLTLFGVLAFMLTYVVGFFATAGAAGVDFGSSSIDKKDVSRGGLVGIALAIILTAGISLTIIAGAYGNKDIKANIAKDFSAAGITETVKKEVAKAVETAQKQGVTLTEKDKLDKEASERVRIAADMVNSTKLFPAVVGKDTAAILMFLLALTAFPSACFSSLIAANSFKTTLPSVNPFASVGIGAAVSILLAVFGWAGDAIGVFTIIGASFGPICGAMMVDYFLSGSNWSGPRAGFNPAGWISWAGGFVVGILPTVGWYDLPAAPVAAFIVGAVLYFVCAKAGMLSAVIPMPNKK
jgi:cytosine permease